jgi:hypothetical protein
MGRRLACKVVPSTSQESFHSSNLWTHDQKLDFSSIRENFLSVRSLAVSPGEVSSYRGSFYLPLTTRYMFGATTFYCPIVAVVSVCVVCEGMNELESRELPLVASPQGGAGCVIKKISRSNRNRRLAINGCFALFS